MLAAVIASCKMFGCPVATHLSDICVSTRCPSASEVVQSNVVAVTAIEAAVRSLAGPAWGPAAGWLAGRVAALLVALNVLGAANATLLCNSRYFVSRDGPSVVSCACCVI